MPNIETLLMLQERAGKDDERCLVCGCLVLQRTIVFNSKEVTLSFCSNKECPEHKNERKIK